MGVMIESHLVEGNQSLEGGGTADLRQERHRRLHRLGGYRNDPASAGGSGENPPRLSESALAKAIESVEISTLFVFTGGITRFTLVGDGSRFRRDLPHCPDSNV